MEFGKRPYPAIGFYKPVDLLFKGIPLIIENDLVRYLGICLYRQRSCDIDPGIVAYPGISRIVVVTHKDRGGAADRF